MKRNVLAARQLPGRLGTVAALLIADSLLTVSVVSTNRADALTQR